MTTVAFDAATVPLAGINLVEASAGTGKTHAITTLYERLIVEAGATVEQILVVTYTKAATAELKERVRARLLEAQRAIRCGEPVLGVGPEALPDVSSALDRAVRDFDRAAIHTIHGFCQRTLEELAFEGRQPFTAELLADDGLRVREVVQDYWRRYLSESGPDWAAYLAENNIHPGSLAPWVRRWAGRQPLQIQRSGALETSFARSPTRGEGLRQLPVAWGESRGEVRELLMDNPHLNRTSYKPAKIVEWLDTLDALVRGGVVASDALEAALEHFSASQLRAKTKKGGVVPEHPFFALVEAVAGEHRAFVRACESELTRMRAELLAYTRDELMRRNRVERIRTFDDLVRSLADALEREGGPLAAALRERHPFALVDEFQDTDPAQLEVFRTIYDGSASLDLRPRAVFFVGDPKQAIYGFRGADVFAYLDGRETAERIFTLSENRRSVGGLVAAVNALFTARSSTFALSAIEFHPAASTVEVDACVDGECAPFRVHELPEPDEKVWGKEDARRLAAARVADEIEWLLARGREGQATLHGRAIVGSDVAVLVRTNDEAERIRSVLGERGIGSIYTGKSSVFSTEQAGVLRTLMCAVLTPQRESWVRAALAGPLFEWGAEALAPAPAPCAAWERELDRFHRWLAVWKAQGFGVMFRAVLEEAKTFDRMLTRPQGDREATNFLHLGELLTRAEADLHLTPDELLSWLGDRRAMLDGANDDAEQRLESDAALLQILTIHRAKGLQFPIVFCPFLWDGPTRSGAAEGLLFHAPGQVGGGSPVLELGPDVTDAVRDAADREAFSESLRLLYVALTRAQYRCHVVWGAVRRAERSPLGWILTGSGTENKAIDWRACWNAVTASAPAAFARSSSEAALGRGLEERGVRPSERPESAMLTVRRFTGQTRRTWGINSFTSITSQLPANLPDHDANGDDGELAANGPGTHEAPRGARVGTCIHGILERIEFTRSLDDQADMVRATVEEFGLAHEHIDSITRLVRNALTAPLLPNAELTLSSLTASHRVSELEFHFPVNVASVNALAEILAGHPLLSAAAFGDERPLTGFLKGYIDLVFEYGGKFYIVDYKTHWLGPSPSSYGLEALERVIRRDRYVLQYLLYAVAVHRYLRCRLPEYRYESHFGGVYYLFLRGMEAPGGGMFFDLPSAALIAQLDRALAGAS